MDTVFHFIFPLIAALGARIHLKHGIRWVIFLALIAVALDLDHFIGVPRGSLHNIFVTVLIPVMFIFLAFSFEKSGTKWKSLSVASLLFLVSQPILDMFDGVGVMFLYPLSTKFYAVKAGITTTISTGQSVYILSPAGAGLIIFFLILSLVYFLDEIIGFMDRKHMSLRKAFEHAFKKDVQKIKKGL